MKILTRRNVTLFLFALLTLTDILTTYMVMFKHPHLNESNPLYLLGLPLIKLVFVYFIIWMVINRYRGFSPFMRYYNVYFIILGILLLLSVTISNYRVYGIDSDRILPISNEQKLQYYTQQVGDLELLNNINPSPKKAPLIVVLFFINMLQFWVWRGFEKYVPDRT